MIELWVTFYCEAHASTSANVRLGGLDSSLALGMTANLRIGFKNACILGGGHCPSFDRLPAEAGRQDGEAREQTLRFAQSDRGGLSLNASSRPRRDWLLNYACQQGRAALLVRFVTLLELGE